MKVASVVGARPQFIKAAVVSRVLRERHTEILIHTGQHYDDNMSALFFDELGIPAPDVNLGIGSASHGEQTGLMLAQIEKVLLDREPDWVLVYGDTNSTLAGALSGAKLGIRVAHVEAGLRSFNRRMPEEINRVLTDHVSDLLLCPSKTAMDNLEREGITRGAYLVGDVMADALWFAVEAARSRSQVMARLGIGKGCYLLVTVHRAENTDDPTRLSSILNALNSLGEPVIFPIHPRTRLAMSQLECAPAPHVRIIEPVGYLDMVTLEQNARLVLTDSGGIQKEAYWLGVPCVTLRDETEWSETVQAGWNVIVGADASRIADAVEHLSPPDERPELYGDGKAAQRCVSLLESAGS
jgi:UDP-GlcNAc3NAcA epimerase